MTAMIPAVSSLLFGDQVLLCFRREALGGRRVCRSRQRGLLLQVVLPEFGAYGASSLEHDVPTEWSPATPGQNRWLESFHLGGG